MNESKLPADWFTFANHDYIAAHGLAKAQPDLMEIICFHCHQSAEKYLKACLLTWGADVPRTHNLIELCRLCENHEPAFAALHEAASKLTPMSTAGRYPALLDIGLGEVTASLRYADTIHAFMESHFPQFMESGK